MDTYPVATVFSNKDGGHTYEAYTIHPAYQPNILSIVDVYKELKGVVDLPVKPPLQRGYYSIASIRGQEDGIVPFKIWRAELLQQKVDPDVFVLTYEGQKMPVKFTKHESTPLRSQWLVEGMSGIASIQAHMILCNPLHVVAALAGATIAQHRLHMIDRQYAGA